jgi:putative FmdB family regulatory protein
MPLYEYECEACGQRFERIQKFSDPIADTCPLCGEGPVHRLMSSPAIQFKGAGWYITDYAKKGKSEGKSEGDSSGAAKTAKSDSAESSSSSTETKSTTSTDSKSTPTAPSTPAKKD